jgi:hypothetical protein
MVVQLANCLQPANCSLYQSALIVNLPCYQNAGTNAPDAVFDLL